MSKQSVNIPSDFCQPPFYSEGETIASDLLRSSSNPIVAWEKGLFVVDIAYERGMYPEDVLPPWKRAEEFIKPAVNSWEQRGVVTLTQCFKERNRHGAKPMMLSYCAIYIQLMHWINEEPVRSLQTVPEYLKSMPYAPMNLEERLFFILQAPDHHHAFTTLMQLFSESVKKWAVFQLRNK